MTTEQYENGTFTPPNSVLRKLLALKIMELIQRDLTEQTHPPLKDFWRAAKSDVCTPTTSQL